MNTEIPMAVPVADPGGVIGGDLSCLTCGYNLRGLARDGRCPECANPIERSARGDLLACADPQWLRRLGVGVQLMLWFIGMSAGLGTIGLPIALSEDGLSPLISVPAVFLLSLLFIASAFCISTPEPRTVGQNHVITMRGLVRACALFILIGSVLNLASLAAPPRAILVGMPMILRLAALPAIIGVVVLLTRCAQRVPDPRLTRSSRIVMWLLVGAFALFTSFAFAAVLAPNRPVPDSVAALFALLGCSGLLLAGVAGIGCVLLLRDYDRAFRNAYQESARDLALRQGNGDGTVALPGMPSEPA